MLNARRFAVLFTTTLDTGKSAVYTRAVPMPIEIVGLGRQDLRLVWEDESEDTLTARELRLACSCAHCKSELTGEVILDPATVPPDVSIESMSIVGNYGVNIRFSDGHNTGIYRFLELQQRARSGQ